LILILGEDFVSDCDLLMACTILQKQIECIDGKKENIIIPSVTMKKIRERQQAGKLPRSCINMNVCMNDIVEARDREQVGTGSSSTHSSDSSEVTMTKLSSESNSDNVTSTSSDMMVENQQENKSVKRVISSQSEGNNSSPVNPCVLCLEEEKRLACIPCGHLATCVPCGHSLRSCPICRRGIDAFVRIYL
jgi:hypothetical protein